MGLVAEMRSFGTVEAIVEDSLRVLNEAETEPPPPTEYFRMIFMRAEEFVSWTPMKTASVGLITRSLLMFTYGDAMGRISPVAISISVRTVLLSWIGVARIVVWLRTPYWRPPSCQAGPVKSAAVGTGNIG